MSHACIRSEGFVVEHQICKKNTALKGPIPCVGSSFFLGRANDPLAMDFSGSGPLTSQVRQLLQDGPMFQFLCQRSFHNHAVDGAVTLPAVAPMVEGVMKSLGRPVSPGEVYRVWNEHCDPDMHHMSLAHFEPFLRALLQDYLQNADVQAEDHRRLAVTRPLLESTGYPEMATLRNEEPQSIRDQEVVPSPNAPQSPPPAPAPAMEETPSQESTQQAKQPQQPQQPLQGEQTQPTQPTQPTQQTQHPTPQRGRKTTPPPKAKADPKHLKDAAIAKAKRPTTPQNSSRSSSKPPAPPIQMQSKPPSFLKDALDEAHGHLVPETKELLPQEELSNEELDHQQPESPGVFASASEALSRLESICQELGETFFLDPDFGPTSADPTGKKSLLSDGSLPAEAFQKFPGHEQVAWHRPCEAWSNKHHFCGEFADVRTGVFGNAWFVGALCSLSMSEDELFGRPSGYEEPLGVYPRVFWDSEFRRRGLYCFKSSKQGQWKYVVVDDRLPFHRKTSQPLFSHAVGIDSTPHVWIALIEKAYAKLHGAYFSLWLGFVDDALEDLTGWPAEKLQISKFGTAEGKKDPAALWSTLSDLTGKSMKLMICLRADAGGSDGDLVHIDPRSIRLDARPEADSFCTGIFRNWAYPIVSLRQAPGTEALQFVRLRSFTGTWHGPWGDQDLNWSQVSPELVEQLHSPPPHGASLVFACQLGQQEDGVHPSMLRPIMPFQSRPEDLAMAHDGTFFMRFEDWMQVYSHVLLRHQLNGWSRMRLEGSWMSHTCGGTPIPVMQPVLATLDSWARNPQCLLSLEADFDVELCVTLHQFDARLNSASPFPFEDQLRQIFLCIMHMDGSERLTVFDKKRIVRHNGASAATPLSQRRSVLLQTQLKSPGRYAIVPSIWEPELPKGSQAAWMAG